MLLLYPVSNIELNNCTWADDHENRIAVIDGARLRVRVWGTINVLSNYYADSDFIISENSQVANARFQAAAAIQNAAIREWGFLSSDNKRSMIRLCHSWNVLLFVFSS